MPEPLDFKAEFKLKLADLDQRLQKYDPNMGALLTQIHQQLISIPELSYMLSEEEIGKIIEGNKRQMKLEITTSQKKETVKGLLSGANADDF